MAEKDIIVNIGSNIRMIRKEQKRTLQEVADSCGFTRSLLSKIENGKTIPPIATLSRIAESLGVKVSVLLEYKEDSATVFTPKSMLEQDNFIKTAKGYSFFAYAVEHRNKLMQPFLFVAEKGKVKSAVLSHVGEEFIYVLEGEMKYKIGNVEYYLSSGDSLYFNSVEEHELFPVSEKVVYLAIFTESQMNKEMK